METGLASAGVHYLLNNGVYFYHSHRIMKDIILNLQSAGLQRISRGAGIIFFIATLATKLPGDPRLLYS